MMRKTARRPDTIPQLQADRGIYGRCPHCDEDFPLKQAVLFYANEPMPAVVQDRLAARRADLCQRTAGLQARRRRAHTGATQQAIDVNLGKILEKVAPVCEGFGCVPRDCRPLFDPIDYIVFNGLSRDGTVDSITFIDVKTGGGGLNQHQRQVRAAVEASKVEWQEYTLEG